MLLHFDGSDGTPVPTELGITKSRSDKEKLLGVTLPLGAWDGWMKGKPPWIISVFLEKLLAGMHAARNNRGPKQKQRMDHQITHQLKYATALGEIVSIFGLGPTTRREELPPVDLSKTPPFDMEGKYIFFSVDVEWKDRITEVGVSILDTLDLVNVPPGENGENWAKMISSHHLRTGENCEHASWKRCNTCPKKFGFGQSENLPLSQLAMRVDELFSPPYGHSVGDISEHKLRRRPLILIGHGMAGDLTQLAKTDSKTFEGMDLPDPSIIPNRVIGKVWDINWLWRVMRRTTNARSLKDTLADLEVKVVPQAPFHNGGNDAHYTMLALLRILLIAAGSPTDWTQNPNPIELVSGSILPSIFSKVIRSPVGPALTPSDESPPDSPDQLALLPPDGLHRVLSVGLTLAPSGKPALGKNFSQDAHYLPINHDAQSADNWPLLDLDSSYATRAGHACTTSLEPVFVNSNGAAYPSKLGANWTDRTPRGVMTFVQTEDKQGMSNGPEEFHSGSRGKRASGGDSPGLTSVFNEGPRDIFPWNLTVTYERAQSPPDEPDRVPSVELTLTQPERLHLAPVDGPAHRTFISQYASYPRVTSDDGTWLRFLASKSRGTLLQNEEHHDLRSGSLGRGNSPSIRHTCNATGPLFVDEAPVNYLLVSTGDQRQKLNEPSTLIPAKCDLAAKALAFQPTSVRDTSNTQRETTRRLGMSPIDEWAFTSFSESYPTQTSLSIRACLSSNALSTLQDFPVLSCLTAPVGPASLTSRIKEENDNGTDEWDIVLAEDDSSESGGSSMELLRLSINSPVKPAPNSRALNVALHAHESQQVRSPISRIQSEGLHTPHCRIVDDHLLPSTALHSQESLSLSLGRSTRVFQPSEQQQRMRPIKKSRSALEVLRTVSFDVQSKAAQGAVDIP
jgi:hypothetical protein